MSVIWASHNFFFALAVLLFERSSLAPCAASSLPIVDLGYARHRASTFDPVSGLYNFSNIRYAAPPTGNLRFAPPLPPAVNDTSINDGLDSHICPQASPNWLVTSASWIGSYLSAGTIPNITYSLSQVNVSAPKTRDPRENEDCLFLDVFAPQNVFHRKGTCKKAPVLVHIHGGGYATGSKYDDDFEGLFARAKETYGSEFIWVSLNYRLGALGFLAGPEFVSKGGVPNLGLLDQRLALRWVRNNIHLFGGDKDKVTAIGGSAGAGSIIHHIAAYGGTAENDFQKAFAEAPAVLDSDNNAILDKAFADFLGFAGVSSLSEARNLPSQQVINANAAQVAGAGYGSFIFGPAIDGSLVTRDPKTILDSDLVNTSLSVLVGHNTNEGYGFGPPTRNETEFRAFVAFRFPNATQSVIDYIVNEVYPPIFDGSHGYTDNMRRGQVAVTEFQFICSANALAHAVEEKAFAYAFDIPPAIHATDAVYVLHNPKHSPTINTTVANVLQDHVLAFIFKGSPESSLDGIDVPPYGKTSNAVLFSSGNIKIVKDPAANSRCEWWRRGLYN
ncbi:hypothetical protein DL764_007499 [Monosporascus ibericus]|uniref:Carboxylesterase type B domain-containing protein n=1 Tax=Monosporascus ibericus TaxID=155417 RepID=A0A4Q4T0E6_9PEZI|nr:hypothetical protein DL764_007499 [Monosporascus ibericus]